MIRVFVQGRAASMGLCSLRCDASRVIDVPCIGKAHGRVLRLQSFMRSFGESPSASFFLRLHVLLDVYSCRDLFQRDLL